MAIPKIMWSCWIGGEPPDIVKKCIESQRKCCEENCYEYRLIDNEYVSNILGKRKDFSSYVYDAIFARKWVKASDYLRVDAIYRHGGFYMDGDFEVLEGNNFDHLLNCKMFVPKDPQGHYGNAGFGSEPNNEILKRYLNRVERNFRGDGELVYEPGIRAFSDMFYISDISEVRVLTPDYFFPWNHITGQEEITENTLVKHHYLNSWVEGAKS